jgi:hypothetical protein
MKQIGIEVRRFSCTGGGAATLTLTFAADCKVVIQGLLSSLKSWYHRKRAQNWDRGAIVSNPEKFKQQPKIEK